MAEASTRGVEELKKVSSGYFHPPKKGLIQSFKFKIPSSEVVENEGAIEKLYRGYSVGNGDIVFNVNVKTTTRDFTVELIRVSQKYNIVHLVNCVVNHNTMYHCDMLKEPIMHFTAAMFNNDGQVSSAIANNLWPVNNILRYEESSDEEMGVQQPSITFSGIVIYEDPPLKILQDISTLLNSEENSDVKICVGEEKKVFVAHKCILSSRSSFFRAMFSSNMRESVENIVNLPDDSPEIFEQVLHYIYTETCPEISKKPADLLILADKYDLHDLHELCEEEIVKTMNTENVCDYLVNTGMIINAKETYDKCYRFIRKNKHAILKTVGWGKLKEIANSQKFLLDVIKEIEK